MIFVTGDTHGSIDIHKLTRPKFPESRTLTKDDYVIICGDFGLVWNYKGEDKDEGFWLRWLEECTFTTLFIDGNHECFPRLNEYPEKEWHGGRVHEIRPHILHLMRGEVFNLEGKTFFAMGGAASTDRGPAAGNTDQVINRFWWPQEIPSAKELENGWASLEAHDYKVDFIITHCLPTAIQARIPVQRYKPDALTDFLQEVKEKTSYGAWYCGHYHQDRHLEDSISILFEKVLRIV